MAKTRHELEAELAALDQAVEQLLVEHEDAFDFWHEFDRWANRIADSAEPEDQGWVLEEVDAILVRHGIPTDPDA